MARPALPNTRRDVLRSSDIDIGDNNDGTVGRKLFAQGTANSGCAASHERDTVFKVAARWRNQRSASEECIDFVSHRFIQVECFIGRAARDLAMVFGRADRY